MSFEMFELQKRRGIIFSGIFLFFSVLLMLLASLNFVSGQGFINCWQYSGTNNATCISSGGDTCVWRTQAVDPWCIDQTGCCMEKDAGYWRN